MEIAIKIINNKPYIDKDFVKRFGRENAPKYGYTIITIEEKYNDCVDSDFVNLTFDINTYLKRKNAEENQLKINQNIKRMDELSKDFIQYIIGATVPDLDIKKQEFVRLHNEVRNLQGKEPRIYYFN